MPDGYLMGGVSSELIPIMARKNSKTGFSDGAPSPSPSKTHVLAMSDGTLLCSSENSSVLGVWRPDGLERRMLVDTGYRYNVLTEVPGGCVIGASWQTEPMYYYDKATDTLTDLKLDGHYPFDAIVRDGRVWLIVDGGDNGSYYGVGEFDVAARKYAIKGKIYTTYYMSIVCFTAEGVVLRYRTPDWSEVIHWHFVKGLSGAYRTQGGEWKVIGYVGGKLLLSSGYGGTGAALLDVSANTITKYELGGAFKGILDPLAETKDYIWAGHNDGICRIAKSNGALELAATGSSNSNTSMDRYSSHEVEGGWLIAPRNWYGDTICYLERDTQKLTVMLSGIKGGSSGANDMWRLPDGKYIIKQRAAKPLYLCNISAKMARALPGTEAYGRVVYVGGTQVVAARNDTKKIVWYDIAAEKQTHEGGGYYDDAILMISAPDDRYAVLITAQGMYVADSKTHTSVSICTIDASYRNSVSAVYRRGKWLLVKTSWEPQNSYTHYELRALDMRGWRVYEVADYYVDVPYGDRECEQLYG